MQGNIIMEYLVLPFIEISRRFWIFFQSHNKYFQWFNAPNKNVNGFFNE